MLKVEVLRLERKNEGQPQWSPQIPEGVGSDVITLCPQPSGTRRKGTVRI